MRRGVLKGNRVMLEDDEKAVKGNGEALKGDGKALICNGLRRCIKDDGPMLKCDVGALKGDRHDVEVLEGTGKKQRASGI